MRPRVPSRLLNSRSRNGAALRSGTPLSKIRSLPGRWWTAKPRRLRVKPRSAATNVQNERRDSKALEPDLISDPHERAEAEARNGLRQYDAGIAAVRTALE